MKKLTCLMLLPLLAAGCTHTLKITNAKKFQPVAVQPVKPMTIGFASIGNDRLLFAAVREVKRDASITDAKEDYKPGSNFRPDYVCQLSSDTKFKAAGQNFLITFPGFLVFTHALAGYKYTAEIHTRSRVLDAHDTQVSQIEIVTPYDFRHCSFARGSASGCCGWLLPGYGAAAIIPGAIFASSYDKRATSEFLEKVEPSYSRYVASKLLEQLSQAQSSLPPKATSTLHPQTLPVAEQIPATPAEIASEAEYAVYLMNVEDNQIGQPKISVKVLPDGVRRTLQAMSETGVVPDHASQQNLLISLGVSSGDFMPHLNRTVFFTQVDDRIVPLRQIAQDGLTHL